MKLSRLLVAVSASAIAVLSMSVPANADTTTTTPSTPPSSTPVTLSITAGSLSVSMPGAGVPLDAVAGQTTVASALGLVSVIDLRGSATASWNATVVATALSAGSGTPPIPASAIGYTVVDSMAHAPAGYDPAGVLAQTSGKAVTLSPALANSTLGGASALIAVAASNGVGTSTVTWNPLITVTIPTTAISGTAYGATVTHSVL